MDFQVQTRVIQVNFSNGDRDIYKRIADQLKDFDIGILVNNVGVLVPYPMKVEEMNEQLIWDHIHCNMVSLVFMTSLLLPGMKERKRGIIVNVGSTAALKPLPYLCVYSATKVFLDYFSQGLKEECRGSGVSVQTLVPYYINTKMVNFSSMLRSGGLMVPSAVTYAKHAVATLGVASHTTGYVPHGVQYFFLSLVPDWIYIPIAAILHRSMRRQYDKDHSLSNNMTTNCDVV